MGQLLSSGTARAVTKHDVELYGRMRRQQAGQSVPVLQHRRDGHDYLYVALFDGTGQSANDAKQLLTNVGRLKVQVEKLAEEHGRRIGHFYAEGIGTQKNPMTRLLDGAMAYTWDDKIREAYKGLAVQTKKWIDQDPKAEVRLAGVGYSRGAVLVPGFARLVDQYGIADPGGLSFGHDAQGNLTVEASRTLVPPGQVAQAVGLFDPVGTNMPRNHDARLPKSVLSGFAQIARDEQRELFPHQTILDPDWSDDGRFLSATIPGGHSNVGGGNREAGLEVLAFNGMVDYLNALSDRPLFEHRPVPADPAQYTIVQAGGATAAFGLRMDHDGQRNFKDELANCKIVDLCHDADPMDVSLARQFEWQQVRPLAEPTPALPESSQRSPALHETTSPSDRIMADYLAALRAGDELGMSAAAAALVHSDDGQKRMADVEQDERKAHEALPGHDHPLFGQAMRQLERLGPEAAGYWDHHEMRQMAGSIALEAQRQGLPSIDDLYPIRDGDALVATSRHASMSMLDGHAVVDTMQAMTRPLERSLQTLTQETEHQAQIAQLPQMPMQAHEEAQAQQRSVGMSR